MASLYNKTILLHGDGRLSDTIQFCRYAPLIAARGARVILQVAEPLRTLMKSLGGVAQVVSDGEVAPDFDLHCAFAQPALRVRHQARDHSVGDAPICGRRPRRCSPGRQGSAPKAGAGSASPGRAIAHDNDRTRSLELRTLTPLFELGATFVRLQKNLPARDEAVFASRGDIIDQTELLNDLCDTAALISALDLVIAVDTSVAHLAGAMAKPVWLMLPYTPDGRWLLGRQPQHLVSDGAALSAGRRRATGTTSSVASRPNFPPCWRATALPGRPAKPRDGRRSSAGAIAGPCRHDGDFSRSSRSL